MSVVIFDIWILGTQPWASECPAHKHNWVIQCHSR